MTQDKPTIEGNKLIAGFMGVKEIDGMRLIENAPHIRATCYFTPDQLEYHTSWDWLMPVIEKISNHHYPEYWGVETPTNEWDDTAYLRTFGMRDSEGNYMVRFNANVLHTDKTLIKATWNAVVEFIKDYNENN